MFGLSGSKAVVGLDIGSGGIKAAELKRTRRGMVLAHAGMEPLPAELVVDSMIMDSPAVATSVNKLLTEAGIKGNSIATSVSGHSVIVKRLAVPPMTEQELDEHIHREAAQSIPFDISDVNLDYQVLSEDGDSQTDVVLVAVKKDKILNYTNVLSMAGKQTAIVDIDGFALQNCYEFNYEPTASATVALLNLGASVMNINIVKGRTPMFTRDVNVGGRQYTDSLQKELDMSFDDAEAFKLGRRFETVSDDAKEPILQQVTELIVLEVQKAFDFFRATSPGEHIEKIYLAGGAAKVAGLVEAMRREFSLAVEFLNPFERIEYSAETPAAMLIQQNPGQMAVAVGLALRSFAEL